MDLMSNVIVPVFTVLIVVLWLWVLYDIFTNSISTSQKVFWIIIVILFNFIGIIFYVLLGRQASDYKIVKR